MATAVWAILAVLSLGLAVLAFALYATVGAAGLNDPAAFVHDGPRNGRPAPPLQAIAISGDSVRIPSDRPLLVLFTDHSLVDFPDLLELLCGRSSPDLPQVVVLAREESTTAEVLRGLGLQVPAALVPSKTYDRYRVRVMPYAVLVGADGNVVHSALVNTAYQLRRVAHEPAASAVSHGSRARPS